MDLLATQAKERNIDSPPVNDGGVPGGITVQQNPLANLHLRKIEVTP
jgi:hypothetical protein